MKSGSFFLREMSRMTSSSSPGGSVSDSMSVTKPCRYFCPTSASRSCGLVDIVSLRRKWGRSRASRRAWRPQFRPQVRHRYTSGLEPGELCERDVVQGAPDGPVDALPRVADPADVFDAAVAVLAAALGDRDRPFQGIEYRGRTDSRRRPGQVVAPVSSACRGDEPGALQSLQELADRGGCQARPLGDRGSGMQPLRVRREVGENDGRIVRQLADPQHDRLLQTNWDYFSPLMV